MRWAMVISIVLHGLGVAYVKIEPSQPPPPDKVVELTFLSRAAEADVPDEALGGNNAAEAVQTPPAPPPSSPTTPNPRTSPSAPQAPRSDFEPSLPEPAPTTAPSSSSPRMSFRDWQASRNRGLPGLQPRSLSTQQRGDGGRDLTNSRGTKQCTPRGQRVPEVVFVLIDSSGSMDKERQDQAISCAQQYAQAALDLGAMVGVGNFADQASFTKPTRDLMEIGAALRSRANGQGTLLPSTQLGGLIDRHVGQRADLVIVSDGYLPNYREAMPWYSYFLKLGEDNRGYLYTVGYDPPREVSDAFVTIGFGVYVYRWL
jgi:hypothetical protein